MPEYLTFGGELPEPDPSIATARIEWQQRPLDALYEILAADAVNRIEDQEDALTPVYRELVREGTRLVNAQDQLLGTVASPLITTARTMTGTQSAMLAGVPTAGGTVTGTPGAMLSPDLAEAFVAAHPQCLVGQPVLWGSDGKSVICTAATPTGGTTPIQFPEYSAGTVPDDTDTTPDTSPDLPPIPNPFDPDADVCRIIGEGTITLPPEGCIYLYVNCTTDAGAEYQVIDCCTDRPPVAGKLVVGPFTAAPDQATITAAVRKCIELKNAGIMSAELTPEELLSPDETFPDDEDDETGEDETGEDEVPGTPAEETPSGEVPVDEWVAGIMPLLTMPLVPKCPVIAYENPDVCLCVADIVRVFGIYGDWAGNVFNYLAEEAATLNDRKILIIEAAIGRNLLKVITGKIGLSDPTVIEVARAVQDLAEAKFAAGISQEMAKAYEQTERLAGIVTGPHASALYGLYVAKGFLQFVSTYTVNYLSHLVGGPDIPIDYAKVMKILDICIQYVYPIEVPSMSDVESIFHADELPEQHLQCLTNLNGHQWPISKTAMLSRRSQPTEQQLVMNYLRLRPAREHFDQQMRRQGWHRREDVDELLRSYEWVPPPSNLIHYALRDVFDPAKLGLAEMRAEYNQQQGMKELFNAQGIDVINVKTKDGRVLTYDIPFLEWAASYVEVSPTQVFEMFHRLRANRVERYPLPGPDGKPVFPEPVAIDTVRKLLKEADYNPIWRDRLAAIAYRTLGRIDQRHAYKLGGYGTPLGRKGFDLSTPGKPRAVGVAEKGLSEDAQDLGYSPIDADRVSFIAAAQWEDAKRARNRLRQQRLVCSAYTLGSITKAAALDRMKAITGDDAAAVELVDMCDAEAKLAVAKQAVRSVGALYSSGRIDNADARQLLTQQGIAAGRIDEYLKLWNLKLAGKTREVQADKLCQWYTTGLLDRDEFTDRLLLLRYRPEDVSRIIASCELGYARKTAAERERVLKLQQAEAKRLAAAKEKVLGEQAKAEQTRMQRFLATRTDKHLIAYWKEGLISPAEIAETLAARGFSAADVQRWMQTYLKADKGATDGGSN